MSDDHSPTPSVDDLQFSTAEPGISATPASGPSCTVCGQAIVSDFFALGEAVLCPSCCARATAPASGSKLGRVFKSSFLGMAAGLIGAVLWFVIRRVAHMEVGLVAVLVGFMVGKAVRSGSGDRGGRGYQVLAVTITYCCIAINGRRKASGSGGQSSRR